MASLGNARVAGRPGPAPGPFPRSPPAPAPGPAVPIRAAMAAPLGAPRFPPAPAAALCPPGVLRAATASVKDGTTLPSMQRLAKTYAPAAASWRYSAKRAAPWAADAQSALPYALDGLWMFANGVIALEMSNKLVIDGDMVALLDVTVPLPVKESDVPDGSKDMQRLAARAHLEARDWVVRARIRAIGEQLAEMPPAGFASVLRDIDNILPDSPEGIPKEVADDWSKRREFLLKSATPDNFIRILTLNAHGTGAATDGGEPDFAARMAVRELASHIRKVLRLRDNTTAETDDASLNADAAINCLLESNFPFKGVTQLSAPGKEADEVVRDRWNTARTNFYAPPPPSQAGTDPPHEVAAAAAEGAQNVPSQQVPETPAMAPPQFATQEPAAADVVTPPAEEEPRRSRAGALAAEAAEIDPASPAETRNARKRARDERGRAAISSDAALLPAEQDAKTAPSAVEATPPANAAENPWKVLGTIAKKTATPSSPTAHADNKGGTADGGDAPSQTEEGEEDDIESAEEDKDEDHGENDDEATSDEDEEPVFKKLKQLHKPVCIEAHSSTARLLARFFARE